VGFTRPDETDCELEGVYIGISPHMCYNIECHSRYWLLGTADSSDASRILQWNIGVRGTDAPLLKLRT